MKLREAEENRRFLECREVFYFYFVCVCVLGVLNFVVSLARARKVKRERHVTFIYVRVGNWTEIDPIGLGFEDCGLVCAD